MVLIIFGILITIFGVLVTTSAVVPGVILIALGVFLLILGIRRRSRRKTAAAAAPTPAADQSPAPAPAPAPDPAPAPANPIEPFIQFRLAGVTFNNRQRILKGIDEDEEKYIGFYTIEKTEYQGAPAFRVVLNDFDGEHEYDVGMVPAPLVDNVLAVYDRITKVNLSVYGGYDDKSYGASVVAYYKPD